VIVSPLRIFVAATTFAAITAPTMGRGLKEGKGKEAAKERQ